MREILGYVVFAFLFQSGYGLHYVETLLGYGVHRVPLETSVTHQQSHPLSGQYSSPLPKSVR
jgi:hypothetical protein